MCVSQKDDGISLRTAEVEISVTEATNKTDVENELKQPLLNRSRGRVPQIGKSKREHSIFLHLYCLQLVTYCNCRDEVKAYKKSYKGLNPSMLNVSDFKILKT